MKWCKAFNVLVIDIGHPSEKIAKGDFRLGVAGPVQRCALPVVLRAKTDTFFLEIVEGYRLVSLSCDMQQIDAVVVDAVEVGTNFQ